jgi:hypothetical protein
MAVIARTQPVYKTEETVRNVTQRTLNSVYFLIGEENAIELHKN